MTAGGADHGLASSSTREQTSPYVSIVVPVYRNEADIPALVDRLERYARHFPQMEAVIVDDGSPDGSGALLEALLARATFPSRLIRHARNFGAFEAIRTGMRAAGGDRIAFMAADLQEPESLIPSLVGHLDGHIDVAIATRTGREDPLISRAFSALFWSLHRRFIDATVPRGGVDVFACTRRVAKQLVALPETRSSLIGLMLWVGFERVEVPYVRQARRHGVSAWTFGRRLGYALDNVFAFTALPITSLIVIGLGGMVVVAGASIAVTLARLRGGIPVQGYTALMLAVLFSAFLILFGLGIVGQYAWRAYENSKQRPSAVVRDRLEFKPDGDSGTSRSQ